MKRRKRNADAPVCKGITAKGEACTHKCLKVSGTDSYKDFCGMHDPQKARKQKYERAKRTTEHSHAPGVSDPACELCRAHGDILLPGDMSARYIRITTTLPCEDTM